MIYSKLTISGTEIIDANSISVNSSLSENNSASDFNIEFDNVDGRQKDKYNLNDPIQIHIGQAPLNGLIGYWNFQESGNYFFDMMTGTSGNQISGVMHDAGIVGSCVSFDGTKTRVAFRDAGGKFDIGSKDNYSISVWFKSNIFKDQSISEHWEGGGYPWAIRGPLNTNWIQFGIYDGAANPGKATSSGTWNDNNWHHLVGIRDWDNQNIQLWMDGSFIGSSPDTTNGDVSSSSNGFAVGARQINGGNYFSGCVDEFMIFNRALTPEEPPILFRNGSATINQKIMNGIIENIGFDGEGVSERLNISGRDYTALLQDITVAPIVYRNREASYIVKDIMKLYVPSITYNNVKTTSTTIERITFNQVSVFDALIQLAEASGYYFYIDGNKDLHFELRQDLSTNLILNNTNTLRASFQTEDRDIYNKVWCYGARILTGASQTFGATGGSVFTLTDKPHSTTVFVNGSISQPGGVINISDPNSENIKWLIDYDNKSVIFASGTFAGDNIPASGATILVNYDRYTPIIKFDQDATSINAYGAKTKILKDDTITTIEQATAKVNTFLAENKDPIIQGNVTFKGIYDMTPGHTVRCYFPNQEISGVYSIFSNDYEINPETLMSERVMNSRINKKVGNITDTIKELILGQRRIDLGDEGEVTNFQLFTGSTKVRNHWEVYTLGLGSAFLFHVEGHDLLECPEALLGDVRGDPVLAISGGDY